MGTPGGVGTAAGGVLGRAGGGVGNLIAAGVVTAAGAVTAAGGLGVTARDRRTLIRGDLVAAGSSESESNSGVSLTLGLERRVGVRSFKS